VDETYVDKMQVIHLQKTIFKESIFYIGLLSKKIFLIFFIAVIPSNELFCLTLSTYRCFNNRLTNLK
jgi:hypothetical protein